MGTRITSCQIPYVWAIGEVEFYDVNDTKIEAHAVEADSVFFMPKYGLALAIEYATDGEPLTPWSSDPYHAAINDGYECWNDTRIGISWLIIELDGGIQPVNKIMVHQHPSDVTYYLETLQYEMSNDYDNWTTPNVVRFPIPN